MVLTFLLFGVTQTPDGVFRRPHPGKHGEAQVLFIYQDDMLYNCVYVEVIIYICFCMAPTKYKTLR